ncbi:MAG: sulfotransferase [Telluria sp.]
MSAPTAQWQARFERLFEAGMYDAALALCAKMRLAFAASPLPLQLEGQVHQRLGQFGRMRACAEAALQIAPAYGALALRLVEALMYECRTGEALARLGALESDAGTDPQALQAVGQMYLHFSDHVGAMRCYAAVARLRPGCASAAFNLASTAISLGQTALAEQMLEQAIALDPGDFGSYLNRSMLRNWDAGTHHIDQLRALLRTVAPGSAGQIPLCYALAKELEDIGASEESFAALQRGAAVRRAQLRYKVGHDVDAMAHIAATFDGAALAAGRQRRTQDDGGRGDIFILGLPRSGTTLVERILSSHSQVDSVGEVNCFAFALMGLAGAASGKHDLIGRSAAVDLTRLGQRYDRAIAGFGRAKPRIINKTPENFLYLGLIHGALPSAAIVHLQRHPLDSCYAMYKTLFRMGYPFSYDLADLGAYYVAYHRLMQHWREQLPHGFIDLAYEEVVASQEQASRRVVAHCDLAWEDGCLQFHRNRTPVATASSAQVRRPIYTDSVGRWKDYAKQLAPLCDYLSQHGIDLD